MKKILSILALILFASSAQAAYVPLSANTLLGSLTGSPPSGQALSIPSCSTSGSALGYTTGSGLLCNTSINAATVTTINGLITNGANITITGSGTSGSPYSIASTGGANFVTSTFISANLGGI